MIRSITTVFISICSISLMLVMFAGSFAYAEVESNRKVTVKINFGDTLEAKTVEAFLQHGQTVLEVLQSVAIVETHPVGKRVFVTGIDGVKGKRGETAWYYTVDGKSADKLAAVNVLEDVDRITWIYKKDVCSWKVDE